jgi:hypothetical protein
MDGTDIKIILVSSANKVDLDMLFIMDGESLMYNRKNSGLSIEPNGTPCLILSQSELFFEYLFFNVTLWYLSFNLLAPEFYI